MGGRGSSSMTGGAPLSKMSYSSLDSELKKVDSEMAKLGEVMERASGGHMAFMNGVPGSSASDSLEYRAAQREYQRLQGTRNKIIEEMTKKAPKQRAKQRVFINGFGEATDREITTASYRRWQKNIERETQLRMRGYR